MRKLAASAILFATLAFGQQATPQPVGRTLQFARTTETEAFREMTILIRTMTEIREATDDPIQRTLALRGPAEQIAIADWLFSKLDPPGKLAPGIHEFRIAGSREDTLRLYQIANAATVQDFQEFATMIRTTSDIRYAFPLSASRILALRASAGQIAMADWLLQEVDQPLTAPRVAREHFVPNSVNDVIRVFYFPAAMGIQEFQESSTAIRTATQIRRAYTWNTPRTLTVRGTIEQLA